jgi:hypothetical protein
MFNRRQFLQTSGLGSLAFLLRTSADAQFAAKNNSIVSRWASNPKA